MRRLKVGIRPQLIIITSFASLFSLLILGIVTGIYFSENLTQLQLERLFVISQLKTTQVEQAIAYIAYQFSTLSSIDSITIPLSEYRAGNNSQSVFTNAQNTLKQYIASTETFAAARLYNLDLQVMASSYNNATIVSEPARDFLFPLQQNASIPSTLLNNQDSLYITGPVANDTNNVNNSTYFFGLTLPVYTNTSIIINQPYVAGYLSIIASADAINSALNASTEGLQTFAIKPIYGSIENGIDNLEDNTNTNEEAIAFQPVFPIEGSQLEPGQIYNINSSESIKYAITHQAGQVADVTSFSQKKVSSGFTQLHFENIIWEILVIQDKNDFDQPIDRLKKIIIGVVIGIGAFMCLITFPLAVWFIRPITKLKTATEEITSYKKSNQTHSGNNKDNNDNDEKKRNSVFSNVGSEHSSGMRLPTQIPRSKKFFKDELTELSEAFNIMSEELDKQYTHLEDRVKSRTKELEASKLQAEAANEAKTVFIANISHELRTPLNGILGMTSIAMDEEDCTKIQDSLKLIHRSGELLLHILTELLTYSKNTLNRSKLEKSTFQIFELVYQTKSIFSKLAHDQRVNLKIFVKPNIFRKLYLYGDSNRMLQIIMNLVSNSLKFTPIEGSVTVTFKLLGEYDAEKSKEENFEKVYIKNETTTIKATGSEVKEKKTSKSLRKRSSKPEEEVDNILSSNDDMSILTLSTQEYENKVFESQFNLKPLPSPPSQQSEPPTTATTDDKNDSISSETKNISSSSDSDEKEKPSILPTQAELNKVETRHNVMPQPKDYKSYTSFDKKPEYDLSMAPSADFGGDKYRVRKMYKSKIWVVQIEVDDTGPGIEPALQEKVFEPFVQGDQTLSRSYGGTGLGLSICKQLAKMMHGTLTLKSTIGKGSKFILTLPIPQVGEIMIPLADLEKHSQDEFNPSAKINRKVLFKEDEEVIEEKEEILEKEEEKDQLDNGDSPRKKKLPPSVKLKIDKPKLFTRSSTGTAMSDENKSSQPTSPTPTPPGTSSSNHSSSLLDDMSHLKLLVAEDNLVNQEVIKRMLKLEGFENITMACNGAEAIEFVKEAIANQEPFDLIFMDVQMPKVDGLLATKMIRQNLNYKNPIIALTAFADDSNYKECLTAGMSGYLPKPIRRQNLRKIIVENAHILLNDLVLTPHSNNEDKRLGYGKSYIPPPPSKESPKSNPPTPPKDEKNLTKKDDSKPTTPKA
ncbi:unnamed protein product [Candida verbasci]|uniref:histidine kinase n=1 Tax=Candida verbasci TaxID=1227364 RepID=A0A9W4TU79_9ASCO|nr:unnamed protein product [Candida verbasci]